MTHDQVRTSESHAIRAARPAAVVVWVAAIVLSGSGTVSALVEQHRSSWALVWFSLMLGVAGMGLIAEGRGRVRIPSTVAWSVSASSTRVSTLVDAGSSPSPGAQALTVVLLVTAGLALGASFISPGV